MDYICVAIGGMILGVLLITILALKDKTHGYIDVDHETQQCRFHITSADLSDRRTKKAIFKINHDVKISREEQSL